MGRNVLPDDADGPCTVRADDIFFPCRRWPLLHILRTPESQPAPLLSPLLSKPLHHRARRLAGGYSDKQIRMGERAFGNLHEQSIMFLVSLWMHALFVDVSTAASLGWAWLAFRLSYVVIWALTAGDIMPGILLSTMPMYGCTIPQPGCSCRAALLKDCWTSQVWNCHLALRYHYRQGGRFRHQGASDGFGRSWILRGHGALWSNGALLSVILLTPGGFVRSRSSSASTFNRSSASR